MVGWNRFCDLFLEIRPVLFISKIVLSSSDWSDYSNVLSLCFFIVNTADVSIVHISRSVVIYQGETAVVRMHSLKKKKD